MQITAIVPAAGSGLRLRKYTFNNKPKQFWTLGSNLVIEKVLLELERSPYIKEVILACPRGYQSFCRKEILRKNNFKKTKKIVSGGTRRADTVYNCLMKVSKSSSHVLIHDGVRPFLTQALIARLVQRVGNADGVIAARPVVPTLKRVKGNIIIDTVDRNNLWEAETPQLFKKSILKRAFALYKYKGKRQEFTDEGSLVEAIGGRVKVLRHEAINLKITTPSDYKIAKGIMEATMVQVGMGYDIHRLVTGRDLMIGGVKIPFNKGCLGHSDGDPLLHAIADALLGAASLGDIGECFPDTDPKYKNIASKVILSRVMKMITNCGLILQHVDTTVIVQKPNLKKYKDRIKRKVAGILDLKPSQVNIKAKTKEELESEGSGFSISAFAVVTLMKS